MPGAPGAGDATRFDEHAWRVPFPYPPDPAGWTIPPDGDLAGSGSESEDAGWPQHHASSRGARLVGAGLFAFIGPAFVRM